MDRLTGSCHCGAVSVTVPRVPETVTSCNCSICRRLGALWAYFPVSEVAVTGETQAYVQGDKTLATHRCTACGCVSHWSPLDPSLDRMAVNWRLMPLELLDVPRVRKFDGAETWTYPEEQPGASQ